MATPLGLASEAEATAHDMEMHVSAPSMARSGLSGEDGSSRAQGGAVRTRQHFLDPKMVNTGNPLIIATKEEIEEAVQTARNAGATQIALLKCTSAYSPLLEEMNLRTIPELAHRFGAPKGLPDHTIGTSVPGQKWLWVRESSRTPHAVAFGAGARQGVFSGTPRVQCSAGCGPRRGEGLRGGSFRIRYERVEPPRVPAFTILSEGRK